MSGVCRAWLLSCLGVGVVMALAGWASANPIIAPEASTALHGAYQLFITNLPVDILLFSSLFLLVLWKLKSPLRTSPKNTNMLVAQVVIAGIVVAAMGALIDFYSFYSYYDLGSGGSSGYYSVYTITVARLVAVAAVILVTVLAVSLTITRMRFRPSLVIAGAVAAFNFIVWIFWDYGIVLEDGEGVVLLAGIMFLFVPPVLFGIVHLHGKGVRE